MNQVPTAIWNQIAHEEELQTQWAKQIFPLPSEQMRLITEKEENL